MKLEYQITHLLHPHYVEGDGCVYDHINWTVWFSNKTLLDEINEQFGTNFELEQKTEVSESEARSIWKYIDKNRQYVGVYGDEYDINILDMKYEDTNRNRRSFYTQWSSLGYN